MFVDEPFPVTARWAREHLPDEQRTTYEEYSYAVSYHLGRASTGARDSSSSLWRIQWGRSPDWSELYVTNFNPEWLIWNGDVAIREAASALETGLVLLNFVLGLGVDQTKVRWGPNPQNIPLRQALLDLPNAVGTDVIDVLDEVFGSIGYELLKGYRDWATHRSAPSLEVSVELPGPLPTPKKVLDEPEERQKEWLAETHLVSTLPEAIKVRCWPFVPPVQTEYSIRIGSAEQDIHLPGGIHIGAGARNVEIKDTRLVSGSLTDNAENFRARNPLLLEKQRATFGGEILALYSAMDYVHAVGSVVRFANDSLRGKWDQQLYALCEAR